jgi:hypothetical protein
MASPTISVVWALPPARCRSERAAGALIASGDRRLRTLEDLRERDLPAW